MPPLLWSLSSFYLDAETHFSPFTESGARQCHEVTKGREVFYLELVSQLIPLSED
jgi:hypothetical protein